MGTFERTVFCAGHGRLPWEGNIVCAQDEGGCGRVYQTSSAVVLHYAPYDCFCGEPLMPSRVEGGGARTSYTARAICAECFRERTAAP